MQDKQGVRRSGAARGPLPRHYLNKQWCSSPAAPLRRSRRARSPHAVRHASPPTTALSPQMNGPSLRLTVAYFDTRECCFMFFLGHPNFLFGRIYVFRGKTTSKKEKQAQEYMTETERACISLQECTGFLSRKVRSIGWLVGRAGIEAGDRGPHGVGHGTGVLEWHGVGLAEMRFPGFIWHGERQMLFI